MPSGGTESFHYVLTVMYRGGYYNGYCYVSGQITLRKDIETILTATIPEVHQSGKNAGPRTAYTNTWTDGTSTYSIDVSLLGGNWENHNSYAGGTLNSFTIDGNTILSNIQFAQASGPDMGGAQSQYVYEFMY